MQKAWPTNCPPSNMTSLSASSSWTGSQINSRSRQIHLQRARAPIISAVCQLPSLWIISLAAAAAQNRTNPCNFHMSYWALCSGAADRGVLAGDWKTSSPQLFPSLPYHRQNLLLLGNCCWDIHWAFSFAYLLLLKVLRVPWLLSNSLITIPSIAYTFAVPPVAFMWSCCFILCSWLQILLGWAFF